MAGLEPIEKLIRQFSRLPGVGRRSAERMALRVALDKENLADELARALRGVAEQVQPCSRCGNLTLATRDPCRICTDAHRDAHLLCVVEDPLDIQMIERAGVYHGRYHALMGKLSPAQEVGVEDLRVRTLLERIREEGVREVLLATCADVEGDATASFLHDLLTARKVKVSRLALGLPAGGAVAYSDPVTLARAIEHRNPWDEA